MKRMIGMLAAALLCAGLLGGCAESTVINPENEEVTDLSNEEVTDLSNEEMPDLPQLGPDGLVWELLWKNWAGIYQDTSMYPFALTVNANFNSDEDVASFFLLTNTAITEEEAANYAMEVVKGLGYLISEQNSSYEKPSETSFGGYLSDYTIYVMVAPDDSKSNESTWILEDTVPAGEYREFKNSKTAEEQSGEAEEGQSSETEE